MDEKKFALSSAEKYFVLVLLILYTVGVLAYRLPFLHFLTDGTGEPLLFLGNMGVLFYTWYRFKNGTLFVWLAAIFVLCFMIEVVGVNTGFPFGNYHYGESFRFKWLHVPLIIAFNWAILILGSLSLARILLPNRYLSAVAGALFIFIFDWMMEPVAISLDFWQWSGNVIPIKNYISWFVISFGFNLLYVNTKNPITSPLSVIYFGIQFLFFTFLRLF